MFGTALQLVRRHLLAEAALLTADAVTAQLDDQIERSLCTAIGLRIQDTDMVLDVKNFVDHTGAQHEHIRVPARIRFNTGRISPVTGKPARGHMDMKLGCAVIELSTESAEKDVVERGSLKMVPRHSMFFSLFKSTLAHEMTHALDISTGIPRFKARVETKRLPDETQEQYRVRYHNAPIEVRAFTRQLLYTLSMRIDARGERMTSTRMSTKENAAWYSILNGTPAELLATCVDLKIVAKKFLPWLENLQKNQESGAMSNLYREITLLQEKLREKYEHATTTGT